MQLFLGQFISTLTTRRQERVSAILEEAKVGKDEVSIILQRLTSFQKFSSLIITEERAGGFILGSQIALNFRDIDVSLAELYRIDNLASDLINSDVAVLSSQIKALEDEVVALEKLTDNYAFLLADGGSFNYAYLESFNDNLNRDSFDFNIPDRASQVFGSAEQAQVRSDEGVLALAENVLISTALTARVINANASAYVITNNGIENALTPTPERGWRYVVASPNPVSSSIPEANNLETGAQVQLEFLLNIPGPVSEIQIVPFAEHPVDLIRVELFTDALATSGGQDILDAPRQIDRPVTLHFPVQTVAKFRMVVGQSIYERVVDAVDNHEAEYRALWEERNRKGTPDIRYQYLSNLFFANNSPFLEVLGFLRNDDLFRALPVDRYDPNWGALRPDQANSKLHGDDPWNTPEIAAFGAIIRMIANRPSLLKDLLGQGSAATAGGAPPQYGQLVGRTSTSAFEDRLLGGQGTRARGKVIRNKFDPPMLTLFREIIANASTRVVESPLVGPPRWTVKLPTTLIPVPFVPRTANFNYTYYLGLQFVGIGLSAPGYKGVFVSKAFDSDGDIGECRIKTSETNFRLNSNRDDNLLTSVEYSVSNVSRPNKEADWIPILPIGSDLIESERFFPDATGLGLFRFTASRSHSIYVYRNGTKDPITISNLIYDALSQVVLGVSLPLGETSATDIFTVSYTPSHDFTTINFSNAGFADLPLVTAHDQDGAGEGFVSSGGRNTIDLLHSPYVDEFFIQQSLTQKTPTYQPITVVFANGDVGQNFTNYGPTDQFPLPAPPTAIPTYLHSGRTLIFNDSITQSFRVFYQYLQNNVRTRVVLRVDDKGFVSPHVDFVQLKAKTRRAVSTGVLQ